MKWRNVSAQKPQCLYRRPNFLQGTASVDALAVPAMAPAMCRHSIKRGRKDKPRGDRIDRGRNTVDGARLCLHVAESESHPTQR